MKPRISRSSSCDSGSAGYFNVTNAYRLTVPLLMNASVFISLFWSGYGVKPSALASPPLNPALSSDYLREMVTPPGEELDLDACEAWNPEFVGNGMRCCGTMRGSRRQARCDAHRNRANYCGEITEDQKEYVDAVTEGKVGDLLDFLTAQAHRRPLQAMCTVNSGFLVHGRPIVPTSDNIIRIRSPGRCTNYGTEPMVAMLEWLGRQIKKEFQPDYPRIHFLLGDALFAAVVWQARAASAAINPTVPARTRMSDSLRRSRTDRLRTRSTRASSPSPTGGFSSSCFITRTRAFASFSWIIARSRKSPKSPVGIRIGR